MALTFNSTDAIYFALEGSFSRCNSPGFTFWFAPQRAFSGGSSVLRRKSATCNWQARYSACATGHCWQGLHGQGGVHAQAAAGTAPCYWRGLRG